MQRADLPLELLDAVVIVECQTDGEGEADRRRAEKELLPANLLRRGKGILRRRGRGRVDRRGGLGVTLFRFLKAQKLIDAHAVETAELHELAQLGLGGAVLPLGDGLTGDVQSFGQLLLREARRAAELIEFFT